MSEGRAGARLRILAGLVLLMFSALTVRLWYLQVLAAEEYAAEADHNRVRLAATQAMRGQIEDANGVVLVGNELSLVVTANEQKMGDDAEAIVGDLAKLLDMSPTRIGASLQDPRYYDYQPVPVAVDIHKQPAQYIQEHYREFPGVTVEEIPVRVYPEKELAAHVLGYTGLITEEELNDPFFEDYGRSDLVGKTGLERAYERQLQGEKGIEKYQVDAAGTTSVRIGGEQQAVPGSDLVLHLDGEIQRIAEEALALGIEEARGTIDSEEDGPLRPTGGAVVVMDPETGGIKAMASSPTFDPSVYIGGITPRQQRRLENAPFDPQFNRAAAGSYPPGSTFKPFIALSALRNKVASLGGSYDCPTSYKVPGDTSGTVFNNWSSIPYGFQSVRSALIISCDTVFYPWGYQFYSRYLGTHESANPTEPLQRDLRQFGFGHETGLDVAGEESGLIPDQEWFEGQREALDFKGEFQYEFILPGEFILMTIGQGKVLVTPLQLATAYSAIANGGRVCEPQVAAEIRPVDGKPKPIKPDCRTLPFDDNEVQYVKNALASVPSSGTAQAAFVNFPFGQLPVAGKTGTAEVPSAPDGQDYSWFAAMAPVANPDYVIVALIEQGGHGSTTAAPVVRRIIEDIYGLNESVFQVGQATD